MGLVPGGEARKEVCPCLIMISVSFVLWATAAYDGF